MKTKIFKNFSFLLAGEMLTRVSQLAAVIYLARILGVEAFGVISFALAIMNYLLYTTNLGLNEIGVREISHFKTESLHTHVNSITFLRTLFSFFSILLIYVLLLATKLPSQTKQMILIFSFSLIPYALSVEWVFRGKEKMQYVSLYKVINAFIYTALVIFSVKNILQIQWVGYSKIIADSLATVFIFLLYTRMFNKEFKFSIDLRLCKKLLMIAVPVAVTFAVSRIYYNIDTIMLGFIKNNFSVGIYNASYKILTVLNGMVLIFVTAIFPTVSRLYIQSREELSGLLRDAIHILLLLGLPIGIGGTILSDKLIHLIYGFQYIQSAAVFKILIWSGVLNSLGFFISYSLFACNMQKKYMFVICITAVFNIVSNLILIPAFDYMGAAVASVLSQLLLFIISYVMIKSIVQIRIGKYFLKIVFASLVMGILIFGLRNANIFAAIFIGAAVYFGVMLLICRQMKNEIIRLTRKFIFR